MIRIALLLRPDKENAFFISLFATCIRIQTYERITFHRLNDKMIFPIRQ